MDLAPRHARVHHVEQVRPALDELGGARRGTVVLGEHDAPRHVRGVVVAHGLHRGGLGRRGLERLVGLPGPSVLVDVAEQAHAASLETLGHIARAAGG